MTLIVAAAEAADLYIPTDWPTVQDCLDNSATDEPLTIHIDPGETDVGASATISNREVMITSTDSTIPALVPTLYVTGGDCTVKLDNLRVESAQEWHALDGGYYTAAIVGDRCRSLIIDGLDVAVETDHHIILLDTDASVTGYSHTGDATSGALWAYSGTPGFTLDIADSTFDDLSGGALLVQNSAGSGQYILTVTGSTFRNNTSEGYADLYAYFADVSLEESTFAGSTPVDTAAPIRLVASSFSAYDTVFDRTGTDSRVLYATSQVGSLVFEEVKFIGGTYETMLHTEGYGDIVFRHVDVDLRAETSKLLLSTGGSPITVEDTDIYGANVVGTAEAVIYTEYGSMEFTRSRICDVYSIAGLYLVATPLTMEFSVIQGPQLRDGGHAVRLISATDGDNHATIHNNTFAGVSAWAAFGGSISGTLLGFNNVFYENEYAIEYLGAGVLPPGGLDHTLWYGNDVISDPAGDMTVYYSNNSYDDPQLTSFDASDCSTWPIPAAGSPVEDAGYAWDGVQDPDGSPIDLGAIPTGSSAPDIGWHGDDTGEPTDTGDTGDSGETGDIGETGETAETGDSGETGDTAIDTADPDNPDPDGDGYTVDDCDPNDATVYPGAPETPEDGLDQDCDGVDGTISLGGGACGCAGVRGAPVALGLLAALALRRRRG